MTSVKTKDRGRGYPAVNSPDDEALDLIAFVREEETLASVRNLAERRGWDTENLYRGGLPQALRLLGLTASPRHIIIDVDNVEPEEVFSGVAQMARNGSAILALGSANDVRFYRNLLDAGVREYATKPINLSQLGAVFSRVELAPEADRSLSRAVAVIGAAGGVGATTITTCLGHLFSETLRRHVVLVDPDLKFGHVSLLLDVDIKHGLKDAMEDIDRVDEIFLKQSVVKLNRYLHVLSSQEELDTDVEVSGARLRAVIDCLRRMYTAVVVDLSRSLVASDVQYLDAFQDVIIVMEPTATSLRDALRLHSLGTLRNPNARFHLVMNKVGARGRHDLSGRVITKEAGVRLDFMIPWMPAIAEQAVLEGRSLVELYPQCVGAAEITNLMYAVSGLSASERKGVRRTLGGRPSLVEKVWSGLRTKLAK